jgi:hypothetical protein
VSSATELAVIAALASIPPLAAALMAWLRASDNREQLGHIRARVDGRPPPPCQSDAEDLTAALHDLAAAIRDLKSS